MIQKSESFIHKSYNPMNNTEELQKELETLIVKKETIEAEIQRLNIQRKFAIKNIKSKEEEIAALTIELPTKGSGDNGEVLEGDKYKLDGKDLRV